MIKRIFMGAGIVFLLSVLVFIFIYFQQPKNFEETAKYEASR